MCVSRVLITALLNFVWKHSRFPSSVVFTNSMRIAGGMQQEYGEKKIKGKGKKKLWNKKILNDYLKIL
jgi:hypothetical protein